MSMDTSMEDAVKVKRRLLGRSGRWYMRQPHACLSSRQDAGCPPEANGGAPRTRLLGTEDQGAGNPDPHQAPGPDAARRMLQSGIEDRSDQDGERSRNRQILRIAGPA